ncbi:MAG TPA: adenylate/guanylate cyclase domain-containing protein [Terriglobia bacterium]|nr:adenylate/guanylate cyclase domain-containing protein [Terriglobia bacterium]
MKQSTAPKLSGATATRRLAERLAIELPIGVRVSGRGKASPEQTRTLDLSRGGASFATRRSYRAGMNLQVSFVDLRHLSSGLRQIPAQVVRVVNSGPGQSKAVAVRFADAELASVIFSELLRMEIRTSSALLGIIQALSPGAEMGAVIEEICRTTERALDSERAFLFLHDPHQKTLHLRPTDNMTAGEVRIHWGEGLVGKAAVRTRPTNVPSLSADRRYRPDVEKYFDEHTRSVLCVPLSREHGVSPGLLVIINKRYSNFGREDEALGTAVASQIAVGLREAGLYENIRSMKNYYERIMESIATGILTFDKSGKLSTINQAGCKIFGFQPGTDTGRDFKALFSGTANARLASLTGEVLSRKKAGTAYDIRFLRRDNSSFSLNLSALPLHDTHGNLLGGVLVAEDITHEQRLMNTLCRYMAREVAEQVLHEKDKHKLGGTRTEVTILLTDIRNFTSISEQMDPWDVVELLNSYFPGMINIIFRHQGMVDKFIGDSILAVFGVPVPREDDALRAARAALEMQKGLHAINRQRARQRQKTLEIGIGITSGTVISGNIGSERRMDYTVIGDPVNLAARLEGLTKEVKRRILVNDRVHAAIAKEIPCEPLGLFTVKGKREKVPVFAVTTDQAWR